MKGILALNSYIYSSPIYVPLLPITRILWNVWKACITLLLKAMYSLQHKESCTSHFCLFHCVWKQRTYFPLQHVIIICVWNRSSKNIVWEKRTKNNRRKLMLKHIIDWQYSQLSAFFKFEMPTRFFQQKCLTLFYCNHSIII